MAAEWQIPASSARRHCPIKREENGSETWKSSPTCLGHWDNEVWSVRAQLGDTSHKTSPPSRVPGAEALSKSNRKLLWILAQTSAASVGKAGGFGSPPHVRIGCEARGGAAPCGGQEEVSGHSVPEPQPGVGVEGQGMAPFGVISLTGKTVVL